VIGILKRSGLFKYRNQNGTRAETRREKSSRASRGLKQGFPGPPYTKIALLYPQRVLRPCLGRTQKWSPSASARSPVAQAEAAGNGKCYKNIPVWYI
jgi:hypothetical protein